MRHCRGGRNCFAKSAKAAINYYTSVFLASYTSAHKDTADRASIRSPLCELQSHPTAGFAPRVVGIITACLLLAHRVAIKADWTWSSLLPAELARE